MKTTTMLAALLAAAVAIPAAAQNDGPRDGPGMPPPGMDGGMREMGGPPPPAMDAADFLLAHTGDLKLTDGQVVRLAAISRRAADRRQQLRSTFEARRDQMTPGLAPSPADRQRMMQQFEQVRDQTRADLRDALAVLTPDQQAQAWEMAAREHGGGPGRMREGMHPGGGMRMRRPDGRGQDGRGPDGRGPDGRGPGAPPQGAPPAPPQG
jgi:hypothetical protein